MFQPYVHEEIAAEPYVHEEIAAEAYIHEDIPAEQYVDVQVRLLSPMSLSNLVSGSFRKFPLWLASHFRIMTSFFIIQ